MKSFIHLHTHSYYSFLDGIPSPEDLVLAAKKQNMDALALTDHNGLYGAIEFYRAAREHNIKPIIGAELTLNGSHAIVLLVKNTAGYRNLCHLISRGRLNGGHGGFKLTLKDFTNHTDGLVCLSGGHKGRINNLLSSRKVDEAILDAGKYLELFEEDFYLEMQYFSSHDALGNIRLRDFSAEYKIPLVATNNVHFVSNKDWYLRRIMHAIADNTILEKVTTAGNSEQYFKNTALMYEVFSSYPEALKNTTKIARSCDFEFSLGKPVFPSVDLPKNESSFSCLWKKCFDGATRRYQPLTGKVIKRLEYELQVINDLGFAEYFLIVKAIADYCHREHIPCVGRGSAADSLVSYVLEITQVDPIRHNLYFERFLNPQRSDPPDIDLDICWKNRDKVIQHIYNTYGEDRTAMICTFNTFQNRSAIRDIAKTYGLPEDEIAKITKHLPHRAVEEIGEAVNTLPELQDLRQNINLYEEIIRHANRIADFPRHLSIHPGGVIIAPDRITNHTPLEIAGKGIVISQYDMYSIEKLGLVKMDILGVRSLSVITDSLKLIKQRLAEGKNTSGMPGNTGDMAEILLKKSEALSPLDLRAIPEDDARVTGYIRSGQTMGCFQLESPGMRGLLKKMLVENVNDVITAVALIRPGAAGSGMKDVYIKRRAGLETVTHVHPSLAPALDDTYGVIIYQEQVLQVAHFVAKLTLGEADTLRRAMTKSRLKKEFMSVHEKFISGATANGLTREQADVVWNFLSQFVGYGFNKAHSATYGTIAYQTAYLKYFFPAEYMCAVLNNQGGFYSRMAYIEEARRMGIRFLPPDVNYSDRNFTCENGTIRTGLSPVFDLTERTINSILSKRNERPFSDLFDFIQRTRAGEKEVLNLCKAGALASLHPNAPHLQLLTKVYFKNKKKVAVSEFITADVTLEPYNAYQKIINEMEILDFAVSAHPLTLFKEHIDWTKIVSSNELELHPNEIIRFCGWLVTSRRVATSKNQYMKFLTLEDFHGLCEAVLFPAAYIKYGHLVRTHGPYIVTGKVQSRLPGEANLIVDKLEVVSMGKEELEELLQKMPAVPVP